MWLFFFSSPPICDPSRPPGAGGGCSDVQWCFSQVKGAIDDDVAEGKTRAYPGDIIIMLLLLLLPVDLLSCCVCCLERREMLPNPCPVALNNGLHHKASGVWSHGSFSSKV